MQALVRPPGDAARRWLSDLAAQTEGYRRLAEVAGLSYAWARKAARGAVPQTATVSLIGAACGLPVDELQPILSDAAAFMAARAQGLRGEHAECRVCGREERLSRARTFETFDVATRTFVHRKACGNHVEV